MDLVQASKSVVRSEAVTNGATASVSLDVVGFDALSVDVLYKATHATNAPAVLRLVDSNDNTTFGTITKLVSGTDYTVVGGAVVSDVGAVYRFDLGLQDVKRYVKLECSPATAVGATAATVVVACRLHKAEQGPATATAKGALVAATRG